MIGIPSLKDIRHFVSQVIRKQTERQIHKGMAIFGPKESRLIWWQERNSALI